MILRHSFLIILSCMSIVLQKTYGSNIPGIPGVDYPNFNEVPQTSFRCPESKLSGFFPDFETRCQVFHYCEDGNRETFICPIGYIFNPLIKSCDRWFNYECNAPQPNDEESNNRQTNYEVASDGGVASPFQPSSSLFDKMASLFENRPSDGYGQYEIENDPRVNPNVDQYSEYGSSGGSSQHRVETMGENEESRREASGISRGDIHLDLNQNEGYENGGPYPYEPNDKNAEGWDSEDSASLKSSFQDDANLKNRGQVHSERETNMEKNNEGIVREHTSGSEHGGEYKGVGSHSDHSGQSSKGLGVLYYRNPTIYNYHTRSNEHNGNQEGDSIFYAGDVNNPEGDSYSSVYGRDADSDDFDESVVDSDQSMDLQKRISEYRRRPRPKPVVSLIESDLEIVTLPPIRQKRPRVSLVQKNAEPAVTEPMMTTTELSRDAQHKSETTESSSAAVETKSVSEDLTGGDESQMSSDFQQERSGNERSFEDWLTEESSGDAEDFLESEDLNESMDVSKNEGESAETDTNNEQLHGMMRPNIFYVDSNSDHSVKENESPLDLSTDTSSDEQYKDNYGTTYDYKNEEFDMDNRVQAEEYNHEYNQDDNFNRETEDSSEVLQSYQYGDSFDNEKYQYENKNEGTEDFEEIFQTVIDGETKSFIRLGEEIIDATEYYPDLKDESSAEREGESFYDAVDKASKKYVVVNSNGISHQSDESQDLNQISLDEIKRTPSEATEEYFTENEYSYQDGNSSPDFVADSDGTVSGEVTFIPSTEYEFPTTEAYDTINTDGVYMYGGSRDSDTMESLYRGDAGYSNDQTYVPPSYTGEHATFEEQGETNEDIAMSSANDETSSDVIYYYTPDMGSQFDTDQPEMDIATTAMIDDDEYAANTDIQGDSEYAYEVSQSDDSDTDEESKEEYFTTHSAVSDVDVQFVTDRPDYGVSPTAMPYDEGYSRDESIQGESDVEFKEQHFQTDSYDYDFGTRFVTDQPDVEMSTMTMLDGEESSKDTDIGEESSNRVDTSYSEGSDSDEEFKEYLGAHSDFSDADNAEQASELSNQDKAKTESDVTSDAFPNVFDISGTSDISKTMNSNFDKSISSNKHKISETAEKSHSKETSLDSSSVPGLSNFDFDSGEDTGLEMENESSKEDSQSSTSGNSKFKSQSACSTCSLSANRFERISRSSRPGRTGKLLGGSKLAKLASFVKKMVAAKKKAKMHLVKKILPSSEWNTEA